MVHRSSKRFGRVRGPSRILHSRGRSKRRQSERIEPMYITFKVHHFPLFISEQSPPPSPSVIASIGEVPSTGNEREKLERTFRHLVEQWKKDTLHWSSVAKMIAHPSYRRIMGMGPDALPLLLRELRECPDHWLIALNAITGEDPAPPDSTFHQAVDAWLAWGVQRGYLQ